MSSAEIPALLESALLQRESLKNCTNAVRLVNGFGDGLDGLVLEQYDTHFVAQIFDASWFGQYEVLAGFVRKLGGRYFIVKDRTETASSKPDAIKATVWIDEAPAQTEVVENGLRFSVDLNDTLNSGLFLDMRTNRKMVAALSAGKKILNGFAYTCSFGVYCRAAGAASVTNVDISKKVLERGRANYALNSIVPTPNEFIRADVVEYLERAVKKDNRFDGIILDPPSFARHEGKVFSVRKDMAGLIAMAFKVLNPGGFLFVATNFSGLIPEDLEGMIEQGSGGHDVHEMTQYTQDMDFPGSGSMQESYLAAVLAKV
ncbi:MAG: class I SAM-dependent rRNA methyltransferase [Candidatus Omnitrophica bacterium]|nr:class I SAM-dependent rRNA methyltransferase [Candidatus Omnitrophota bacterium]